MGRQAAAQPARVPTEDKKKVPYPFSVTLKGPVKNYAAKALKLVIHGLLVEIDKGVLNVGDKLDVVFDLPANIGFIEASINVVKTYDRQVPSEEGTKIQRIVEVHFTKPLAGSSKESVKKFLKEIKQVGSDFV